jgi:hypothetical protein
MLFLASGCARHGAAIIVSEPEGAEVVDLSDDTIFGITPVKVWWTEHGERRVFVNIRLQKEGYRDKTTSFWVNLDHATRGKALKDPQPVEVILDKKGE